jgi:hypothetical protein
MSRRFSAGLRRAIATAVAACSVALVLPAAAGACQLLADGTLVVNADPADPNVIARTAGGTITRDGVACPGATINTVERIKFNDGSESVEATVDLANGPLAPGKTAESGGTSEIELDVQLGGGDDLFRLSASSAANDYRFGSLGATSTATTTPTCAGPAWTRSRSPAWRATTSSPARAGSARVSPLRSRSTCWAGPATTPDRRRRPRRGVGGRRHDRGRSGRPR